MTINKPAPNRYILIIATLFITCLIISNITASKLIEIQGLILPAAIIVFPISYILGDVLTEVYGYGHTRRIIWLGFICNALAVLVISLTLYLPPAGFWDKQDAYQTILGTTPRLLLASFAAYLFGEFVNAYVLAKLKVMTEGRHLWLRTIGSTIVGQALDSTIFISIAFMGIIPAEALVTAIVTQWLIKSGYEALATPLTYAAVNFLKRREGINHFDRDTVFNPFRTV